MVVECACDRGERSLIVEETCQTKVRLMDLFSE